MLNPFLRASYSFELPERLIADRPLIHRTESKLLVVDRKERVCSHHYFYELPQLLKKHYGDLQPLHIVANHSRVMKARLHGVRKETQGKVEFFILKRLTHQKPYRFEGLIKSSAKVEKGFIFILTEKGEFNVQGSGDPLVQGIVLEKQVTPSGNLYVVEFNEDPVAQQRGETPIPPYILAKRKKQNLSQEEIINLKKLDEEYYNTEYASLKEQDAASVAAPTAGRHFTQKMIEKLINQGYTWNEVLLHVSLGTFKPVEVEDIRQHKMHGEVIELSEKVARDLTLAIKNRESILAVGTTTVRALEGSWDVLTQSFKTGAHEADLFLHPESASSFHVISALLTNFHLPESTLLMMVAKWIGSLEWTLEIYREAIQKEYRFYSYGDAMLIL